MAAPNEIVPDNVAKESALKLLAAMEFVSMATIGEDGGPDVRAMAPVRADSLAEVWFATTAGDVKTKQLKADPRTAIHGFVMSKDDYGEFRLFGEAEVLADAASKRRAWRDDFTMHWPEGVDSPAMVAIRFRVKRGQWIAIGKKGSFTI